MKTHRAVLVGFIIGYLAAAVPARAAAQRWSYVIGTNVPASINHPIDQIVADGGGGAAIVWSRRDSSSGQTNCYCARFDKKGVLLWLKPYTNARALQVTYLDKKITVVGITPNTGHKYLAYIDEKTQATYSIALAGGDYAGDMNGRLGMSADKRGFFVAKYQMNNVVVLQREPYQLSND